MTLDELNARLAVLQNGFDFGAQNYIALGLGRAMAKGDPIVRELYTRLLEFYDALVTTGNREDAEICIRLEMPLRMLEGHLDKS